MSFINANTAYPTDPSQIGFKHQTRPFSTVSYSSSSINYVYDTYVIPTGMWLITASVLLEGTNNRLVTTNVRIAFPNNTSGKNVIVNSLSSGYDALTSYVGEPYYSDGTSDNNSYTLQGGSNSTMTYVKIA
jgi:hypothetical protein